MNTLLLNEDTVCLLVENDVIRELLPCISLHPKDLIDRAQDEGCSSCGGKRAQMKHGRQAQLSVVVNLIARCLSGNEHVSQIKELLGISHLVVYPDNQRVVL